VIDAKIDNAQDRSVSRQTEYPLSNDPAMLELECLRRVEKLSDAERQR
jgi:hypothetical protein